MQTYTQDIEKLLEEGNNIQIKVQGYSMYPLLVPGRDEVVISPVTYQFPLKRGMVVLYRRYKEDGEKDILVLHRIWKVKRQGVFLVGDNQKEVEGPLEYCQIKGHVIMIYRKGKKISTDDFLYRMLSGIWLLMRPIRPLIAKFVSFCKSYKTIKK